MKKLVLFLLCLSFSNLFSQSELLIPRDAVTVFSINNVSLLQKISMDELVQYDFMEEVHQELFDGSTSEKTLKDAGIDFNQRLNVFYGKSDDAELSGFTFGISNSSNLFEVFDDFEELQSKYKNVKVFGSFFNNLIIKNNSALLIRIEPSSELISAQTDSIWYSRGNSYPYGYDGDEFVDEFIFDEEVFDEEVFDEDDSLINPEFNDFPIANEDPTEKNYYELRDSVQLELQKGLLSKLLDELLLEDANLVSSDAIFKEQLTHSCEGTFYLDNSRSLGQTNSLWYFQTIMPSL